MKISNIIFGMIIMSMVCLGLAEMWLDTANNYGVGAEVDNMTMMKNTVSSMNSTMTRMSDKFKADQANANAFYPLLAPITAVMDLFSIASIIPSFISDTLSMGSYGATNIFPSWFTAGIIVIVGFLLIFGIMAYVQRYSP